MDREFRYRCTDINCRKDHRQMGWVEGVNCPDCGMRSLPIEVEYKCLRCGSLEYFDGSRTGISCKACGYRVFVKPRRKGFKMVDCN